MVTASRCEVATHVATLVFGCEVSMSCESLGRHSHSLYWFKCPIGASQFEGTSCSVKWRNINNSPESGLCETQCCPASARGNVVVPVVQASTALVFWSLFSACTRDPFFSAVPWLMSVLHLPVHASHMFSQCSDSHRICSEPLTISYRIL